VRSGELDAWKRADELLAEEKTLEARIAATPARTMAGMTAKLPLWRHAAKASNRRTRDRQKTCSLAWRTTSMRCGNSPRSKRALYAIKRSPGRLGGRFVWAEQSRAKSCWDVWRAHCRPATRRRAPRESLHTRVGLFPVTSAIDVAGTHMVRSPAHLRCSFPASVDRRNTSVPQTLAPDGEF
jgi:hypothetical protein